MPNENINIDIKINADSLKQLPLFIEVCNFDALCRQLC